MIILHILRHKVPSLSCDVFSCGHLKKNTPCSTNKYKTSWVLASKNKILFYCIFLTIFEDKLDFHWLLPPFEYQAQIIDIFILISLIDYIYSIGCRPAGVFVSVFKFK